MTSITEQAYQAVATDSAVLALVGDGANSLLGGDTTPPPPAAVSPWGYLKRDLDVPFSLITTLYADDTRAIDGGLEWWLYDDARRAGYVRLRQLAAAIERAYRAVVATARSSGTAVLWRDDDTTQSVFRLWPAGRLETLDEHLGNTLRLRFAMRLTLGPNWP